VTVDSVTYRAAAIAHGAIERSDESAGGELSITMSDLTPIVDEVRVAGLPIIVTVRQTHRSGVGGVTPVTVVRFKGHVAARTIAGGECEFRVASLTSLLERPLLRVIASPTCNHTVYGPGCAVDPTPFTTTACAITTISGLVLTVADAALEADGYYTAGYLVVESGTAAGERAFIAGHTGSSLTLLTAVPTGLTTADTIAITAGCDGLEATCAAKFSNLDRFLGFPRMPVVNPFDKVE
jgi:uncharacterized phage protein (TIGR02218 family)